MSTTYAESTLPLALQTMRPSPVRRWWAGRRLTLEHRIEIYRYLARELRLGAQLIEAVAGLFWIYSDEGQRIRHPIAVATRSWLPRLREREPLVEVLRPWLPTDELPLVAAIERVKDAGALIDRLESAAKFRAAIQGQIAKVAAYPSLITVLLGVMMRVLYDRVYLVVANAFDPQVATWQGMGLAIVEFVAQHGTLLVASTIGGTILIAASMSRLIGPLRTLVEGVFPWSMYRVQAGTAFLDAFAMLLSAGLQPLDAVRELERSASPYLRWRLSKIRQQLRQAVPVGRAFAEAGRWPRPEITYTLQACRPADLPSVIGVAVNDWRNLLVRRTEQQSQLMFTAFILAAGLLMFWVFASAFGLSMGAAARFRPM